MVVGRAATCNGSASRLLGHPGRHARRVGRWPSGTSTRRRRCTSGWARGRCTARTESPYARAAAARARAGRRRAGARAARRRDRRRDALGMVVLPERARASWRLARPARSGGESSARGPSVITMPRATTVFVCSACARRDAALDGPVPRLRRVEHAQGGDRAARPRAPRGGAARAWRRQARCGWPTSRRRAYARLKTGIGELDRVLGGGLVPGSLVLHRRLARHRQVDADLDGARQPRRAPGGARSTSPARSRRRRSGCAPSGCRAPRCEVPVARRDRPGHGAGHARGRAARGLRDRLGADAARAGADAARPARSARCARSPTGSRGSRRRAGSRCCSSATSPRRARSPARACSSTSSTACCSSRASASAPTARCGR